MRSCHFFVVVVAATFLSCSFGAESGSQRTNAAEQEPQITLSGAYKNEPPLTPIPKEIKKIEEAALYARTRAGGDEALKILTEGLKAHPEHPRLLFTRSKFYLDIGNIERGKADIERGLSAKPEGDDLVNLLFSKALLLMDEGELVEAEGIFSKLLVADESSAGSWRMRAQLRRRIADEMPNAKRKQARFNWDWGSRSDAVNAIEVYRWKIGKLREQGNLAKVASFSRRLAELAVLAKRESTKVEAAWFDAGKAFEGAAPAEVSSAEAREKFSAMMLSAILMYRSAESERGANAAIRCCDSIIERKITQSMPSARYMKGAVLMTKQQWSKAIALFSLVIEQKDAPKRDVFWSLVSRAECYIELGDSQKARADLNRVLKAYPGDREALELLKRISEA